MRRVAFKTIGCRLNKAETAQIAAGFERAGYEVVDFGSPTDICVIHTCTITAKAETTCLRSARNAKKNNPDAIVLLVGCAVESSRERIQSNPSVDLAVGQEGKFDLPALLEGITGDTSLPPEAVSQSASEHSGDTPGSTGDTAPLFGTTRALVKVQDGCDFCCSYCIVPQVRGTPTSRPVADVRREVEMLADQGYKEIVVTGANLAAYNNEGRNLVDLLECIEPVDGIERIRLSSVESSTVQKAVIEFMADSKKLCRYLHLPLQSGDDTVLSAMGRRYTATQYRTLVEFAAGRIPLLGLGTDIIVGFPGETDEAFQNTRSLVEDLPFNNLHVFPYSIRPNTRAASLPEQLPTRIKKERASELIELGESKRRDFVREFLNQSVSVLVERVHEDGSATGWTQEYVEARLELDEVDENDIVNLVPSGIDGMTLLNY